MENYFRRVLLFGIPSFLIITGIVSYELNKMVKVPGILVSLGEASYSLYLLHLPVMAAGVGILAKLNLQAGMEIHAAVIVLLIGVCLGSILFFKWIEKPLISRLNRSGTKLKI
ncbi:MAG: acyltransferase [Chitinophagaceae bacterium]|nr:acyltransferase [Chitinophagaceae bacterium]